MRVSRQVVFLLFTLVVVAVACGQRSTSPPQIASRSSGTRSFAITPSRRPTRWLYVAISRDGKRKTIGWGNDPRSGVIPMASSPSPSPNPEPTAYCNDGFQAGPCFFVTPGGESIGVVLWCTTCSSADNPLSAKYEANPVHPSPEPGLTTEGNSSSNLTSVDCTTSCSLSLCWQPYPTCWAQVVFTAAATANPFTLSQAPWSLYSQNGNFIGEDLIWATVRPTILDLNIVGNQAAQTVSSLTQPNETPSPLPTIMVGQQVQLQVSPNPMVTNVQWHFDSTSTNDVVGDYYLKDSIGAVPTAIPAVPTPSPVPTSGDGISLYWVSGGLKHVYVVASAAPGVYAYNPLVADVYYQIATPTPSVTASPVLPVSLQSGYPASVTGTGSANCQTTTLAVSVGNPCTTFGINWSYSVTVPTNYGAGSIAMVQLGQFSMSGIFVNGTAFPTANTGGLDNQFPYDTAVQTQAVWKSRDAPARYLSTPALCKSMTYTNNFTDFFMYEPAVTASRTGSRIWVTTGIMSWGWTGVVSSDKAGAYSLNTSKSVNPAPSFSKSTALPTWQSILNTGFGPSC